MANIKYFSFENRVGNKINARVSITENAKGVCFVQHGFSGNMDEEHIKIFEQSHIDNSWSVVTANYTNSLNDADGDISDFTLGRHKSDLTDTIKWAMEQEWYKEPIALIGHSAGGFSVIMNASQFNDILHHVIPVSPMTSGVNSFQTYKTSFKDELEQWQRQGYRELNENNMSGRISMANLQKFLDYSAFDDLGKITAPAIFITGNDDKSTPPEHVKRAYNRIGSTNKKMILIDGADHCFDGAMDSLQENLRKAI